MGTVYMLQEGPFIKLGYSGQTPWDRRLHQIRNATARDVVVLAARPGTLEQEQEIHRGADQWKHKGDWYNDCPELRRYCDAFFYPEAVYEHQAPEQLPASGSPAGEALSVCEQPPCEFD
jgi:hypothetical protein